MDCCITKAPCAGARRRAGTRWTAGRAAPNARWPWTERRHTARDPVRSGQPSRLAAVGPYLQTVRTPGLLVEGATIHLERGYDSEATRVRLLERGLIAEISQRGRPAPPLNATKRWVVERTNSWHNAHKKLVWCTERRGRVVDFWVALSDVIIIVRRLVREGWTRYRWEGRPSRRP